MNPQIILFNIFLTLSVTNTHVVPKQTGLRDFVTKKHDQFYPTAGPSMIKHSIKARDSGSIMHKVSHTQELAIFCKMEHELMKASGFAVKFRLGDQSYVDRLEGK